MVDVSGGPNLKPLEPCFRGDGSEESAEGWNPSQCFGLDAAVVEHGVPVGDAVSQTDGRAKRGRQITLDRRAVGQHIERRARLVGHLPRCVGHPMRREIDALLDAKKQVKDREVPIFRGGDECLGRLLE